MDQLPPAGRLLAAFLGSNTVQRLLALNGLFVVFTAAAVMSVVAAIASLSRGKKYLHTEELSSTKRMMDESRV